MPMYEYECSKCHHRFEVIQKFSDPLRTKCPDCNGTLKKLLSAPAIQFKGSGWYVTDYGKKDSGDGKKGGEEKPKESSEDKSKDKKATKDKS